MGDEEAATSETVEPVEAPTPIERTRIRAEGAEADAAMRVAAHGDRHTPVSAQPDTPPPAISAEVWALAAEVGRLYPAVYRRFHVSRQATPGADVTLRMLSALQHLAVSGPLTLGELTLHLALGKATTSELVDRLEAKALVDRMRDDRDKRRVFIWLTDAGRARAVAHPQVLRDDLLAHALARMRPDDRTQLVLGLHALLNAAEELEP
ncbi:MAG TPA: MarR family winged helix-turn-helix transcriptional regulator [Ktedonobacterales bacterium]|nr:MarR family winged helix-turn-helix transcriptional regulator [Ktedonobacterales bacterium]